MPTINPWIIVGFLIALIAVGGGGYLKGQHDGKTASELTWQTREAKINADAANKIAASDARVREIERTMTASLNAVDSTYQTKLKEKANEVDRAIADARTRGLWVKSAVNQACGNPASSTAASAPVSDGSAGRQLLDESDAAFLIAEAGRADKVVLQLQACQAVVRADRGL